MKRSPRLPRLSAVLAAVAVVAGSSMLVAQDAAKVDPAHYKVISEHPAVRIIRVAYAPGDRSPMHSHPDSMIVILRGGTIQFTGADGTRTEAKQADHTAMYAPAGSHTNQNIGKTPVDAILIEFKTPKPGSVVLPTSRPGLNLTQLAEGPRAVAYKVVDDGKFVEPAGTKHDYDQVVIALEPSQMSLALDGKPAKASWARGDVQFIPRGMGHESKNAGAKPAMFAIVAIR